MEEDRKTLTHKLYELGDTFFRGDMRITGEWLIDMVERYERDGFHNVRIDYDYNWDSPFDWFIEGDRVEVDSEYYERIALEKERLEKSIKAKEERARKKREKEKKEIEKEKALLAELKKKYENE